MGIPTDDRSPFDDTLSYEELKELVGALRLLTEQQSAQIAGLEAEIAKLKERLGRNPRNTSMPPSAEGRTKPPAGNRAERRAPTPPEAIAPACYGPGIRALAVYLSVYQHLPYDPWSRSSLTWRASPAEDLGIAAHQDRGRSLLRHPQLRLDHEKHGYSVLEGLQRVFIGDPRLPAMVPRT